MAVAPPSTASSAPVTYDAASLRLVVEPGTGKSRGYANAHELGAAIRRGELGPQARIYHRATDRWLPITVHPEYRRAAAEREEMGALTLQQRQWTFLTDAHSEVEPGGMGAASRAIF